MTDRELLCKEFCELTGGQYHELKQVGVYEYACDCGASFNIFDPRCVDMVVAKHVSLNSTYENPADVLRIMEKRKDYKYFAALIGKYSEVWGTVYIDSNYILKPDALFQAAIDFLRTKERVMSW